MYKIGEIRELIRLLDETSVTELVVENDGMKLLIKKSDGAAQAIYTAPATQSAALIAPVQQPAMAAQVSQSAVVNHVAEPRDGGALNVATLAPIVEENIHTITSPMVGTFYRAPSPDAPTFVEQGSKVTEKSVVCIVEAMKLMNEIEAEVKGEVVEILADNGQLVEYGQPLFKIRL